MNNVPNPYLIPQQDMFIQNSMRNFSDHSNSNHSQMISKTPTNLKLRNADILI